MTRSQLRQIASLAANHCFTRYWFEFKQEHGGNVMAIAFINHDGKPAKVYEPDLLAAGFIRDETSLSIPIYLIKETAESGRC